jgi:hypothetical protein
MSLKSRLDHIELSRHVEEMALLTPKYWPMKTPEEMAALRAHVRRVAMNPRGILVCRPSEACPDPLAALLGPDDPATLRHRGPGVTIARSYGV